MNARALARRAQFAAHACEFREPFAILADLDSPDATLASKARSGSAHSFIYEPNPRLENSSRAISKPIP